MKKPNAPKIDPYKTLAVKLGIDPGRLKDPKVREIFRSHFERCKEIISAPFPEAEVENPPGAVQGARANNRLMKGKLIHDSHGVR
jgi:hypothetical protein